MKIFFASFFIMFYHIFLYGIILKILSIFKKSEPETVELVEFPSITVLCPAFNEEKHIEAKIESFLNLDYPQDKIKMIVISDDSTDKTNEIVQKYVDKNNIELVIQKPRKGKPSGHNLVEPSIDSDYVLSTDANSIFKSDSVRRLVETMTSDPKIGMVIGNLKLISQGKDSGEGAYWKFENFLKVNESRLHSIICANGSLFLLKRELFTQIHPSSVDDFERTLITLKNGYLAKYNKDAIVTEDVTERPTEELKRKIRIISREWFALIRNIEIINPFAHPIASIFIISHKVIRWLLPVWTITLFFSNLFLFKKSQFFVYALILQLIGYSLGYFEVLLEKNNQSVKALKLPAYFLIMNYSAAMALLKFIKGSQQSTWDTKR